MKIPAKPFEELTIKEQKYLKEQYENGNFIEVYDHYSNEWVICKNPTWYARLMYRIKPLHKGEDLIGCLCWVGNKNKKEAIESSRVAIVLKYEPQLAYPYRTSPNDYKYAWPVKKNEIKIYNEED